MCTNKILLNFFKVNNYNFIHDKIKNTNRQLIVQWNMTTWNGKNYI